MRGMDDFFFQMGILHQIQKEKSIMMMMKMMIGMDELFFPNGISHQTQKEKNHIDEDEDRNG
jgi:hypothetical protein